MLNLGAVLVKGISCCVPVTLDRSEQRSQIQLDVGQCGDANTRQIPHPKLRLILPTLRVLVYIQLSSCHIDEPDLRYREAGIEGELVVTVLGEGAVCYLRQHQDIFRSGVDLLVEIFPPVQQRQVRLGG